VSAQGEGEPDGSRLRPAQVGVPIDDDRDAEREERKSTLLEAIDRAARKLARRVDAVRGDLAKMSRADEWIATATLLSAHAHGVKRGAKELVVDDWSSGEQVSRTIPLEPARTAREQADAMFHRAKRMKRGVPIATERLAAATRAHEALLSLRAEVEAALADDALDDLEVRAEKLKVFGTSRPDRSPRAALEERLPYHLFRSGEHPIWVGRGARDNDVLTTKLARPHDLWLHAKGMTGAHVVVPLRKGTTCPGDVLVDAAHLAAHFSDARGETIVEIAYVPRRYVRKRRGSPPGAVTLDCEKVLVLRLERPRLERLLASGDKVL
jgi:predicted ribosome quality control (RQC) complex YloA/Tae2 family protein